jgi:hypothetical protein
MVSSETPDISCLTRSYGSVQPVDMATTKKKSPASTERTGRPPSPDPMTERSLVRYTKRDLDAFAAEVQRLTKITGQRWTISGYLRIAGLAYLGKHLAGGV